jgi:hypothetical protein
MDDEACIIDGFAADIEDITVHGKVGRDSERMTAFRIDLSQ